MSVGNYNTVDRGNLAQLKIPKLCSCRVIGYRRLCKISSIRKRLGDWSVIGGLG